MTDWGGWHRFIAVMRPEKVDNGDRIPEEIPRAIAESI